MVNRVSPEGDSRTPDGAIPGGDPRTPDGAEADAQARLTAWVAGRVQGVGFRWWARAQALELGLTGSAENLEDGRVRVIAQGAKGSCEELLARLEGGNTPGRVSGVTHRWSPIAGEISGFIER
jgi:acylphosphatase